MWDYHTTKQVVLFSIDASLWINVSIFSIWTIRLVQVFIYQLLFNNSILTLSFFFRAFYVDSVPFRMIALANGFWILYYLITMISIIYVTSSTTKNSQYTGDVIHHIIRCNRKTFSREIIDKLSTFSLQVKMRNNSFSCGLFHFDWPLFASVRCFYISKVMSVLKLHIFSDSCSNSDVSRFSYSIWCLADTGPDGSYNGHLRKMAVNDGSGLGVQK